MFIHGPPASEAAAPPEARQAQAAGKFYPADPTELMDTVSGLLEEEPAPSREQKPRILIAPHAGYEYSGPIAAATFRQVQGRTYQGVVVVGFTHRLQFAGASVDIRSTYETPLGSIPVDVEAVAFLRDRFPGVITHQEEAHADGEHSLEVMLPFLQVALEEWRVVPILMGGATLPEAEQLAEALAALARRGDYLFVFSTDLSHYHTYEEAVAIDEVTVNGILSETPQAVSRLFSRGMVEACGRGPILTSQFLAARLGYPQRELLRYANSGDTAGHPANVVGYAAIAMYERTATAQARLSEAAGRALLAAARQTLEHTLGGRESAAAIRVEEQPELTRASGVFVTLRRRGQLRGCIGRIESAEPLAATVPVVALDAALRDSRFAPVTEAELPSVQVEVSVLTPPERVADARAIVAGRDGVILEAGGRRGVFLPAVWSETGWTRLEFLQELASQKAGLAPDAWREAALSVFQDQVFAEEGPASE